MSFYSFDTSVLINGRRDLLPPAVFPSLWRNVEEMIAAGDIRAVDVVRDELAKRDDEVNAWANLQSDLFVALGLEIQQATKTVLASHPKMMGKGGGRHGADPFVIGLALAVGGIVVTQESMSGSIERPRIPDVCAALGVPCLRFIDFVADQGWSW